jgi:prolyl-tRNA editing enzyme YbaK/EbsC (Cys-tRNA(Pro) deacylase)
MAAAAWPEPVERVAAYLREAGAEVRVQEFFEGTPTAQAAADAVGCKLSQIVKSLVVECEAWPVLAMVPGDRRADLGKVAAAVGAGRAKVARPERVEELTGFEPGAVAPFPLQQIDRVLLDRSFLAHRLVWVGAGSTRHMAGVAPPELIRLARAIAVDISSDD